MQKMHDKNGKESKTTRWVDDQGQMQIVKSYSSIRTISISSFLDVRMWKS